MNVKLFCKPNFDTFSVVLDICVMDHMSMEYLDMIILVSTLSSTVTIHIRPYTVPLNDIPTLVMSTVGEGTV